MWWLSIILKLLMLTSLRIDDIHLMYIHHNNMRVCYYLDFESRESSFITFFIPLISPNGRTNTDSQLSHVLASFFILSIFKTKEPFVVSVPAVICLILGRETIITRSCTNTFHNFDSLRLLRTKIWDSGENLKNHNYLKKKKKTRTSFRNTLIIHIFFKI